VKPLFHDSSSFFVLMLELDPPVTPN
jgi:hypothetical protein